jgi:glycerol-3-phosphate dehydrogenase
MLIAVPYGSVRAGLWREVGALWNLWRQGRRHQIAFRFLTTPGAVLEIAPIRAFCGIFIPTVSVISLEALADNLIKDAESSRTQFVFGNEVHAIQVSKSIHVVETPGGTFEARVLINAAGLGAPTISVMAGGPRYDIEYIRGDYYELAGGVARWNIRTLVYPAMPPRSRSKGIHFGPRTDGRLYLGPSATLPAEPPPKDLFLAAARKFLPDIHNDDLRWAYSGIRPKLATTGGMSDFAIRLDRSSPPLINLIGIDSPGLSASMAIAAHVARMVD